MTEILKQAAESWKARGYSITEQTDHLIVYRGEVTVWFIVKPNHAGVMMTWPMESRFKFTRDDFADEFAAKAFAKVNEWLDVLDGKESGEVVRRIVEVRNALQTVPMSPEVVKHAGNVTALEHLVKRLMGGDGS